MCGGDLEVSSKDSIATCPYCDTKQTLPRLDDDRRANLYDRANHFRRNNEYDKAAGLYEAILSEDPADAEAYWSLVLCRYGVEYVEDPNGKGRIPTCNRTSYASITADADYLSALKHADSYQKTIYEQEAKALEDIQKSILETSAKEEPYDIFICYKQGDVAGNRTSDSVLAQDIYTALTEVGYRVFFAGITLESILGSEYEAHIFAALQSAKVMIVVGQEPSNLDAVWVKNEWSRYLALIKEGAKKTLIVAYKDMSPYDLPGALASLQAQDMTKIGAMQDLLRGVRKVIGDIASEPRPLSAGPNTVVPGAESLYQRGLIYLEDRDFDRAGTYFDKVLDVNPKYAPAYVGLLMVELQITREVDLSSIQTPLTEIDNFNKALRFADEQLKTKLEGFNQAIIDQAAAANQKREEEQQRLRKIKLLEDELNGANRALRSSPAIDNMREQLAALRKEMDSLAAKRKALSIFAQDEKHQIDVEFASLQHQEKDFMVELNLLMHLVSAARCQWRILGLDEESNTALVIAVDCVIQMPFSKTDDSAIWATCDLRSWLNTEFYSVLSKDIQEKIEERSLPNLGNEKYHISGGSPTVDKIFCLDIREATQYLSNDQERQAVYGSGAVKWWLRSSGINTKSVSVVLSNGDIDESGFLSSTIAGVRPAMWVKLDWR